ncbi:MAG: alginate lyase family protein, partial [Saprospiraceae bacterium]|nr:alginate lyase family protein [Saprospiraceae bacterium]
QSPIARPTFFFFFLSHTFDNDIDWNYTGHGMLWAYNLNYFDFLQQEEVTRQSGLTLIKDFISFGSKHKIAFDPYPNALRIINWVKFFSKYEIKDQEILDSLWAQLKILEDNPEYHLMGNHLLEDGFGLLIGAAFFKEEKLYKKAKKLVQKELEEQILSDGGHFELAPMYHCTLLWRLLDVIHAMEHSTFKADATFYHFLVAKAGSMLGWLQEMTFSNGDIPLVNDSAFGIAPSPEALLGYGRALKIAPIPKGLSHSGYRKWKYGNTEILMDVGAIGPDYIPGHAHSDTLNFLIYQNGIPFLVDTGISTYEKNAQRNLERSTASHNVVQIDDWDQSEVWGGFRVARRAKVKVLKDSPSEIVASHNGFRRKGGSHERTFRIQNDAFIIKDVVKKPEGAKARAYFHFHPDIQPNIKGDSVSTTLGNLHFEGARSLQLKEYDYNDVFNGPRKAKRLVVVFENELESRVEFHKLENTFTSRTLRP